MMVDAAVKEEGVVHSSAAQSDGVVEEHDLFDVSEDVKDAPLSSSDDISVPTQSAPLEQEPERTRLPWQESVPDVVFVPWYKSTFFALTMVLLAIVLVAAWVVWRAS